MSYLFVGSFYYPSIPPGDLVKRGTVEECREALASMGGYIVRSLEGSDDAPIVLGIELDDGFPVEAGYYAERIDWHVILDDDMNVIEEGRP